MYAGYRSLSGKMLVVPKVCLMMRSLQLRVTFREVGGDGQGAMQKDGRV